MVTKGVSMTQKPCRRWFQFSLRSLLIVMLVLSAGFGLFVHARHKSQEQWAAANALMKMSQSGCQVGEDLTVVEPVKPITWQKRLGIDLPDFTEMVVSGRRKVKDEEALKYLLKLPQLERIWIYRDVDDDDLKALSKFPHLKGFGVHSDFITGEGMTHFVGKEKLQDLYLSGSKLSDRGLEVVARLPGLTSLGWSAEGETSDVGISQLRNNLRLTQLELSGVVISDIGLEHLSTCENLEELSIDATGDGLTGKGIQGLARLKKLKSLTFCKPLPSDCLAALSNLVTLEELRLQGPVPNEEDLTGLAQMNSLKYLALRDVELKRKGLRNLANLHQLESLYANLSGLGDEDMELISSFPKLRRLDLSNSAVTGAGLMKLVGLKELQRLDVRDSKITYEAIDDFKDLVPGVDVVGGLFEGE